MGTHATRTAIAGLLLAGAVGLVSGVPADAIAQLGTTEGTLAGVVKHGHHAESGVQVTIDGAGTTRSTTTDATGHYAFSDVTPGAYAVSAGGYGNSADHREQWVPVERHAEVAAGATKRVDLRLTRGARIVATFARSAGATFFTWVLKRSTATGRVLVAGSSVAAPGDATGDIDVSGLAAGRYTLQAFDDAGKRYAQRTVTLARGERATPKRLKATHRTLSVTGTAEVGATVTDDATPGFPSTAVDTVGADGTYALTGLVAGTYVVTDTPSGGTAVSATVRVTKRHTVHDFVGEAVTE